ncbi:hypothetical protein NCS52_00964000 [Fusarium sp. LHS14.1]|nr:hypothetical protein NCS52_00964000 [Fusarium sp. LHS14.1]
MTDHHVEKQAQHSVAEKEHQQTVLRLADRLATHNLDNKDLDRVIRKAIAMAAGADVAMEDASLTLGMLIDEGNAIAREHTLSFYRDEGLRTHLQNIFPEGHPTYFQDLENGSSECADALSLRRKHMVTKKDEIMSLVNEAVKNANNSRSCHLACLAIQKRRILQMMPMQQEGDDIGPQAEQNCTVGSDEWVQQDQECFELFFQLLKTE